MRSPSMAPKSKKGGVAARSSKAPAGTKAGASKKPAPKRKAENEAAANAAGPSKHAAAPAKQAQRRAPVSQPTAKRRRIAKEFGVAQAGEVFTFGSNPFGALGLGEDVTEKPRPALVELPAPAAQVACGGMHTVALTTEGHVYTWGVNDEGALGRCTSGSAWDDAKAADKEDPAQPGALRGSGMVMGTVHAARAPPPVVIHPPTHTQLPLTRWPRTCFAIAPRLQARPDSPRACSW